MCPQWERRYTGPSTSSTGSGTTRVTSSGRKWSYQQLMNRRQALEALSEVDPHGRAGAPSLVVAAKAARGSV
jgi:hypothetical protein